MRLFVGNINVIKEVILDLFWCLDFKLFACLVIFHFLWSADTFVFSKDYNLIELYEGVKTLWIQFRPDSLSGQNWTQTVCKDYQLMTLACKELIPIKMSH